MKLVVVGGGIAGLAAARAAQLAARDAGVPLELRLLEASDRLGGQVWTETIDGLPLEWGPDSFLAAKPRGREVAEELGLGPDVVPSRRHGRVLLWAGGDLKPLPRGLVMGVPARPMALVEAVWRGILSPIGALRAAAEPLVAGGLDPEQSAGALARRRLGREAAERLVEPLVRGVFGAPSEEVGWEAAFPWVVGHTSLTLSAKGRSPTRGPTFLSIRGGMCRLAEAMAGQLSDDPVRTGRPVDSVLAAGSGYRVRSGGTEFEADGLIVAAPAPEAAALLQRAAPEAARHLASIRYGVSAVVLMRFEGGTLGRPIDGSGFLVTPGEGDVVTACTFLPAKWPHLATPAGVWLRAVVAADKALALPDEGLMHRAAVEVSAIMRAHGGADRVLMKRWPRALPIYGPGHASRIAAVKEALPPGVATAGAYLDGVGIPDCIRTGEQAAREVVRTLAAR